MDPLLQKFKVIFLEEASGLLDQLEKDLLDLEASPDNQELIESAFRAMHTIKGVSGMYGFEYVSEFTHNLESLYQAIRDKVIRFDKQIFDVTFLSVDHIRKLLHDELFSNPENKANHNKIMNETQEILNKVSPENSSTTAATTIVTKPLLSTWHILIRTSEQIYFRGISITGLFHELTALGRFEISRLDELSSNNIDTWSIILYSNATENDIREVIMFIEDDCTVTRLTTRNLFEDTPEVSETELSILDYIENQDKRPDLLTTTGNPNITNGDNSKADSGKKAVKRISVDSAKLDHLMYLVSELITLNSQFNLTTTDSIFERIRPHIEKLDNLSKQFRNNALNIRLVPLSESILRFKRLIRDLSRQLDKDVDLVTEGIDTEVDKGTIDQLNDPLMHIIRNCIDHGIELPHVRRRNGKPETGTIKISANNSGNFVIIRIEDDGAGMDLEKIHQKAVEKGLIKAKDKLSKQELLEMIFLPGFSTAKNLTEVSGRGVGMDVVKRKIAELRGEVIVDTWPGTGTSFTLKLQQSIAIIDTLLFKVEDTFFTVPISDINVCMQIPTADIIRRRHTGTIPFEDQLIPFTDIRDHFNLGGHYGDVTRAILLRSNNRQLALLTDTIIGGHQAVLKPLGSLFRNQKCISAASQLGDGKLAFMMDSNELFLDNENNITK
jgi:two-component system chemotaxis sensor kinase CheA